MPCLWHVWDLAGYLTQILNFRYEMIIFDIESFQIWLNGGNVGKLECYRV